VLDQAARVWCSCCQNLTARVSVDVTLHLSGERIELLSSILNGFMEFLVLVAPLLFRELEFFCFLLEMLVKKEAAFTKVCQISKLSSQLSDI
jgi:hypothetical protein